MSVASMLEKTLGEQPVRPHTLRMAMELVVNHTDVRAAAEKFLDGSQRKEDSPMGHAIGDGCAFGAVCLDVARKTGHPVDATPFAAHRVMRKILKANGVPILRNGKVDVQRLEQQQQA